MLTYLIDNHGKNIQFYGNNLSIIQKGTFFYWISCSHLHEMTLILEALNLIKNSLNLKNCLIFQQTAQKHSVECRGKINLSSENFIKYFITFFFLFFWQLPFIHQTFILLCTFYIVCKRWMINVMQGKRNFLWREEKNWCN